MRSFHCKYVVSEQPAKDTEFPLDCIVLVSDASTHRRARVIIARFFVNSIHNPRFTVW